ncbi:MAG: SufB/SufD family protein [Francisellaceae bacterium]
MLRVTEEIQDALANIGEAMVLRKAHWNAFEHLGLPDRKLEDWKYSDLARYYGKFGIKAIKTTGVRIDKAFQSDENCYQLVMIDGVLCFDDLPETIKIHRRDRALEDRFFKHATGYLSQAAFIEGIDIVIAKGCKIDKPLIITYVHSAASEVVNYANTIHVETAADIDIYECHVSVIVGDEYGAMNIHTHIRLDQAARCRFDLVEAKPSDRLLITSQIMADIAKNAELDSFQLMAGDAFNRLDFIANLDQEGAVFKASGVYALNGSRHNDIHCYVNHLASHTESDVHFRGLIDGNAKATFNAKAYVAKGIKGIKALQNNRNIQLSNTCEINTKPELEIYSDDVICAHGATIGQLDKTALFYMQSRGIEKSQALKLLMEGFVREIINLLSREDKTMASYSHQLDALIHSLLD